MPVLVIRAEDKLMGLTQLTSLSTVRPNRKLVNAATMMTTYCMACYTYISAR